MNVREMFMQCDPRQIYCFLMNNFPIKNFSEKEFRKRLNVLLSNEDSARKKWYLICSPYIATGGRKTDRDTFLVVPQEVKTCIDRRENPTNTMLLCSRMECDCVNVAEVLNAEVCSLSLVTFFPYEICADIFYATAITAEEVAKWTSKLGDVYHVPRNNTFAPSKMDIKEQKKRYCFDAASAIEQNILFYYPHYVTVANHYTKSLNSN